MGRPSVLPGTQRVLEALRDRGYCSPVVDGQVPALLDETAGTSIGLLHGRNQPPTGVVFWCQESDRKQRVRVDHLRPDEARRLVGQLQHAFPSPSPSTEASPSPDQPAAPPEPSPGPAAPVPAATTKAAAPPRPRPPVRKKTSLRLVVSPPTKPLAVPKPAPRPPRPRPRQPIDDMPQSVRPTYRRLQAKLQPGQGVGWISLRQLRAPDVRYLIHSGWVIDLDLVFGSEALVILRSSPPPL